jgi:drug/metabolite transporter (DMT)-like permease
MLLVIVIWGINFVVVKAAFSQVPPLAFTAMRFFVTSLTFLLILYWRRELWIPRGTGWRIVWLGLVGNTLYQAAFAIGLSMTRPANSAMLLSTTPALLALVGGMMGIERITRRMMAGIVLAMVGMVFVMSARGLSFSFDTLKGDLITLLSVFFWVAYVLGVRTVDGQVSSIQLTALSMIAGAPALILLGLPQLSRVDFSSLNWLVWIGLLYSTLLSLVVAYLLYNRSVRRIGSVQTSMHGSAIPVVAALTAWVAMGERPTLFQAIGAALIIAGVVFTRRANKQHVPAPVEEASAVS